MNNLLENGALIVLYCKTEYGPVLKLARKLKFVRFCQTCNTQSQSCVE